VKVSVNGTNVGTGEGTSAGLLANAKNALVVGS
jgi:hypothetical protein